MIRTHERAHLAAARKEVGGSGDAPPSFALSAVDDPSPGAGRCGRSDDVAADLSNGASRSTLHVGTFIYTTGTRPVQTNQTADHLSKAEQMLPK